MPQSARFDSRRQPLGNTFLYGFEGKRLAANALVDGHDVEAEPRLDQLAKMPVGRGKSKAAVPYISQAAGLKPKSLGLSNKSASV